MTNLQPVAMLPQAGLNLSAPDLEAISLSAAPSRVRGILLMIGAVATLSAMDVGLKQLAANYPAMQVTFLRGMVSLPVLLVVFGILGRWRQLAARRWPLHAGRAVLGVATLWLFVYAVSILSLADAYAIFMCAPLLITALSALLLKERIDSQRWAAVCVGMTGVLLVLRPSGAGVLTLGGLAGFGAALGYALSVLTIRMTVRTDSSAATVTWYLAGLTLLSGIAALRGWEPLQWGDWPWLLLVSITGSLGQHLITEAFRHAAPSVIAPLEYTALGWGILFDWLLWMVAPNLRMLIGASIIIASGLYILHRQAKEPAGVAAPIA